MQSAGSDSRIGKMQNCIEEKIVFKQFIVVCIKYKRIYLRNIMKKLGVK